MGFEDQDRFVAKRSSLVSGIDFVETFAPVAQLISLRTVVALAVRHDYRVIQFDVKCGILQPKVDQEIYVH